jgi:hypothetical protein
MASPSSLIEATEGETTRDDRAPPILSLSIRRVNIENNLFSFFLASVSSNPLQSHAVLKIKQVTS